MKLLTAAEAARRFGVHRNTAWAAAAAGLVDGARREARPGAIHAPWVAEEAAWEAWYRARRPPGRPRREVRQ